MNNLINPRGLDGTRKLAGLLLLLITTFFWGMTFTLVKEAITKVDVFVFLSQRFLVASLLLLLFCLIRRRSLTFQILRRGILLGIFLFAAYAFQTVALHYTTASNTGFLTGLSVVFVPCMGAFLFRQPISRNVRWGVVSATLGLFLLCTNGTWRINQGDFLAALCAVCVAWHIILTGKYAPTGDIYWLTALQLSIVALVSTIVSRWSGHPVLVWYPEIAWTLVICILFATVFAFLVQTHVQRLISPSHTALLLCMEPVFAALYAYWAANERLSLWGFIGALLITAGMVISQLSTTAKPLEEMSV
jgi:drug/metabolite transporter (DMT)-like permease